MPSPSPALAAVLADLVLVVHVGIVGFVVGGLLLVLLGGALGWRWVRAPGFRWLHLATVAFIVLQTWFGALCPFTTWEQELRALAGQATHEQGFIEHWLGELIFFQAPWWVFVAAYSVFGAAVATAWIAVPPRRWRARRRARIGSDGVPPPPMQCHRVSPARPRPPRG